jgi:hypothetical protein
MTKRTYARSTSKPQAAIKIGWRKMMMLDAIGVAQLAKANGLTVAELLRHHTMAEALTDVLYLVGPRVLPDCDCES